MKWFSRPLTVLLAVIFCLPCLGQVYVTNTVKAVFLIYTRKVTEKILVQERIRKLGSELELIESIPQMENSSNRSMAEISSATQKRKKEEYASLRLKEVELEKEIQTVGSTILVDAWTFNLGELEKITVPIIQADDVSCLGEKGKIEFFAQIDAFYAWINSRAPDANKIRFFSSENKYLANCLKNPDYSGMRSYFFPNFEKCTESQRPRQTQAAFDLGVVDGKITIKMDIGFNYAGLPSHMKEAWDRLEQSKPCIREFFARQGIDMNINFQDLDKETTTRPKCHHILEYSDESPFADADHWVTHASLGKTYEQENVCAMAVHEIGHKLGLLDTYPDPECPLRKTIRKTDDVMNGGSQSDLKYKHIYPEDLQEILKPLCGGPSSE